MGGRALKAHATLERVGERAVRRKAAALDTPTSRGGLRFSKGFNSILARLGHSRARGPKRKFRSGSLLRYIAPASLLYMSRNPFTVALMAGT